MQSNLETLGQLERRLTMAVPVADIDKQVDERLKQLARTVRMARLPAGQGAAEGRRAAVRAAGASEVLGDAMQKTFSAAVRDQNLRVAGYPRFERKERQRRRPPRVQRHLRDLPRGVSRRPRRASRSSGRRSRSADAEVDKTIEILRKQRARYEPVDRPRRRGDRVTIDFRGTIDGAEFDGGKATDSRSCSARAACCRTSRPA